jgi:hypothetical protein
MRNGIDTGTDRTSGIVERDWRLLGLGLQLLRHGDGRRSFWLVRIRERAADGSVSGSLLLALPLPA